MDWQRWLLWSSLLVAPAAAADPPDRPCSYTGIRRGERRACLGVERTVQGRPYCVHAPATPRPKLPVVLLLHGYSSNGEAQSRYFDLDSHVDARGFILVKPNGTLNAAGNRHWNAGRLRSTTGPDDVGYLTAVLDDVVGSFDADPRRLYVIGHSNGAAMANRLACERSDRIAAMVSLAGGVDPGACRPVRPVSVLTVHGTTDRLVQYGGGSPGPYGSAEATLAFWAKTDGCQPARRQEKPLHLVCDAAAAAVSSYPGCPAGIAVEHWRLDGVGHVPNFALPAWPEAVLDFLWAHPAVRANDGQRR